MDFNPALKASAIGVLINIVLSYVVPGFFSDMMGNMSVGEYEYGQEVADMFAHHKRVIVTSSAIIGVAVFLSVVIATYLLAAKS